jgi:hypothetical protein
MAVGQGYKGNLDAIVEALSPQSGTGDFIDDFRGKLVEDSTKAWIDSQTPSTWNTEESVEQWDAIKQSAKNAGMSVIDWLGEVAFKGSQNPQGMGQEILGAISSPFRKTAEVGFDYINPYSPGGFMHSEDMPDALSFLNENEYLRKELAKNPALAAAPALLGGFGIPVNKWAEGEDVLKGDVAAGIASLTGPVAGLTARGVGKVAQNVAPTLTDEAVDQTRRGLLKAAGVGTGLIAAPVIATKGLMGKTATKVAATGAKVALGASAIARNMAQDSLDVLQTLFKNADEVLLDAGGKRVKTVRSSDEPHLDPSTMISSMGDVKTSTSSLINNMSFGRSERAQLSFFDKINKAIHDTNLQKTTVDPDTGFPVRPDTSPPALTISPPGKPKLNMDAFRAISKENSELHRIRNAFEEKWDLSTRGHSLHSPGQKNYLWDQLPGPKFADDPIAVRQFRDELSLMDFNRNAAQKMTDYLHTIELAVRNIDHLEKTDPNKLKAILNKVMDDTPLADKLPDPSVGPRGDVEEFFDRNRVIHEMAEDMLEAME